MNHNLIALARASFAAATLATLLPAQMAGSYLIDPAGSAPTFTSIRAAINAAFVAGVSANVDFLISGGTYVESVLTPPITGASATVRVTLKPLSNANPVILQGNGGDTFALLGVAFQQNNGMSFERLTFDRAPGYALSGTTFCNGVEIRNCTINSEHRTTAAPVFRHSLIYSENSGNEVGWRLLNNVITFPGRTTATTYGIYLSNGGTWEIANNVFNLNGVENGLYLINQNRRLDKIYNNLFIGDLAMSTSTSMNAVSVIKADVSNYDNDIAHNTFLVSPRGAVGCCISSSGISGTSPAVNRMYGNVFAMTGGCCIVSQTSITSNPFVSNGNLFWNPTGEVGRLGAAVAGFTTLAAWQTASLQDANSIQADPLFTSTSAPINVKPLPPSPVRNAAANTPAYITTDFEGRLRDATPDIGAFELLSFATYGAGCPGTGSLVPVISSSGTLAYGSPLFIDLANAAPLRPALMWMGLSRTMSGPTPLPFSLGGGCQILASPDAVRIAVTDNAGAAQLGTFVPNNPALFGLVVYCQWGVLDTGAPNPYGIVTTGGGALQL